MSPALIAAMIGFILVNADLKKVSEALTGIGWEWAVWVPILNLANTYVEAVRLTVILYPITKRFRIRNSFDSTLIGIIGNVMLPLRFGDGARAYYVAKTENIGLSRSVSALMLDRIADFLVFFILMALTAILHPFPPYVAKPALLAGAIFAAAVAVVFALAGFGHRIAGKSAGKIRNRISREASGFKAGLSVMQNAGLLFPILFLSALSWFLRAAMIWCMFAAFRLDLPLMATPITLILLNFGIAVVSTPANLGGFELATAGALSLFSVEIEVSLSYALALHVIEVVPIIAFGTVFLWFEGFKTRDVLKSAKEVQNRQATGETDAVGDCIRENRAPAPRKEP